MWTTDDLGGGLARAAVSVGFGFGLGLQRWLGLQPEAVSCLGHVGFYGRVLTAETEIKDYSHPTRCGPVKVEWVTKLGYRRCLRMEPQLALIMASRVDWHFVGKSRSRSCVCLSVHPCLSRLAASLLTAPTQTHVNIDPGRGTGPLRCPAIPTIINNGHARGKLCIAISR